MTHKVYITGSTGFLGSALQARLVDDPALTVTGVARRGTGGIVVDDLFAGDWLAKGDSDATIIHCAGLSNPRLGIESLAEATAEHILPQISMVERLCQRGWRGRLVFLSSGGAVYGDALSLPITEDHPTNPKSFYGLHKVYLEHTFGHLAQERGFEFVGLRVSNPYGTAARKAAQGVIPILIEAILNDRPFTVLGDGSAMRDYIHLDDLGSAVRAAIDAPIPEGRLILNIGSQEGISLDGLIDAVETATGRVLKRKQVASPYDVRSNVLGCSRAHDRLGWRAYTPFDKGLRDVVELFRC